MTQLRRPPARDALPHERRAHLLQVLAERGALSVGDVQDLTGVSYPTAARDLQVLCTQHGAVRVHGGALSPTRTPSPSADGRDLRPLALEHLRLAGDCLRRGETAGAQLHTRIAETYAHLCTD
ncbi:DeoR family transcriptional regulator [Motilibacter peucedani]|uniref:DeoR family transcriptional regulator n=1 Tax=Motilibacter peucedani TaxID=598650 RepID=UPI00160108C7|nr:DeoR family transcriptional regulator [Motilibacter peucedani]